MAQVGCRLPWFLPQHERLRVYEAEGVDHDFAFDGLDGVDDDGDGAGSQLFEGLLGVDVDGGEPAAETGMRVVPAYDGFWSAWSVLLANLIPSLFRGFSYLFVCRSISIILV